MILINITCRFLSFEVLVAKVILSEIFKVFLFLVMIVVVTVTGNFLETIGSFKLIYCNNL